MINLEQICTEVVSLSREIGDWILNERKKFSQDNVEIKTFNNLVSYVDKESERRFINRLKQILPNSGILGEEGSSENLDSDYVWIIDPLDGTTNFVHGLPIYCTSVALKHKDEIVLGIVYEPNQKECFYSYKGGKAFKNNEIIEVSKKTILKQSLLATGFPYDDFSGMTDYFEVLKIFMKETRGVRRLGAAALDLCYVACGRFEGFYEYALQPWDVAAGGFIVSQAGGKVTNFQNGEAYVFEGTIIASNMDIHTEIQEHIGHYF